MFIDNGRNCCDLFIYFIYLNILWHPARRKLHTDNTWNTGLLQATRWWLTSNHHLNNLFKERYTTQQQPNDVNNPGSRTSRREAGTKQLYSVGLLVLCNPVKSDLLSLSCNIIRRREECRRRPIMTNLHRPTCRTDGSHCVFRCEKNGTSETRPKLLPCDVDRTAVDEIDFCLFLSHKNVFRDKK